MVLEIKGGRRVVIATLKGDLDHHGCQQIRQDIDSVISMPSTKILVLDMTHISFMDSSGMGLLLARNKLAMDNQVQLIICGASVEITKLLQMVNLDKQILLFSTLEQAIEYVERRG